MALFLVNVSCVSFWHCHVRESSNHRFPDPRVPHQCIWHLNSCPNRQTLPFPQCPGKKRHYDDEFRSISGGGNCAKLRWNEKQTAVRMLRCFQCSRYAWYVSVAKLLLILYLHVDVVLDFMRCLWHLQPRRRGLLYHARDGSHQPCCFRIHLHPTGCQIIRTCQNFQTDVSRKYPWRILLTI